MTTPSDSSLVKSAMSLQNGATPLSNAARMSLDNLLRRELKVNDPNDPLQVAQALSSRYKDNPKTIAIKREAEGVPFLMASATPIVLSQDAHSSDIELQQAMDDVERDLQELTTNSILKDIKPELEGWAMAIRSAVTEGINSARFGIDSRQRDKTFGIRRTLGDYARVARLIGAMTPVLNIAYRKLAQSLDEVAAVLLVKLGESISSIGFNSGRYLLQVAYSDLQTRRDAVIAALRNLVGSTQEAYGPDDWQRGLNAYRKLYSYLEQQAQGDLRSLLVETELARVMDNLLQRAGQGGGAGLRQLGATFQIDVERLRRLVIVGFKAVKPASPPFTAFLDALQLFIDSLQPAGGSRLIRIARPPILFYGLYGQSISDRDASHNLLNIVIQRGILADQLDRFAQSGLDPTTTKGLIVMDKMLYGIDRAIDLYAVGKEDAFMEPDYRAAAYSYVIDVVLNPPAAYTALGTLNDLLDDDDDAAKLLDTLSILRDLLYKPLETLEAPEALIAPAEIRTRAILAEAEVEGVVIPAEDILTAPPDEYRPLIQQELFIQSDLEKGWGKLVEAMAPAYLPYEELFDPKRGIVSQLLNAAIDRASESEKDRFSVLEPKVPAHEAFSLMKLVKNTRVMNVLEIAETQDSDDSSPDETDGEEETGNSPRTTNG
ncbi:MAG TPA: hypothetical protein V6C88_02880 [Chroococcidiopsis sp.]